MNLPIIIYGSSVLRKKAFDIDKGDNFKELAVNMTSTLKNANGLGLAGPQVGLLKNIFIIDTTLLRDNGVEVVEKVCINPQIKNNSNDEDYYNEGCLSIPGIYEDVLRPEKIEVRYRDEFLEWHEEILNGITARIFQHEYDHLQGILFIDRISKLRKRMLKSKLYRISKEVYITHKL